MAVYRCRKDGTDLTALVKAALADVGHDVVTIDVVVEGFHPRGAGPSGGVSRLAAAAERDEKLTSVLVTCPTDDVDNVFVVTEKER